MRKIRLLEDISGVPAGTIVEGYHEYDTERDWGVCCVYTFQKEQGYPWLAAVWVVPDADPDAMWAQEGSHGVFVDEEATTQEEEEDGTFDPVERPEHYNSHPSGVEAITITRHYVFAVGNAIKYLWRAGLKKDEGLEDKEKEIQDLEKAKWYIEDRIKTLKGEV